VRQIQIGPPKNQFFVEETLLITQSVGMSPLGRIQSVLAKPFMPAVFFLSGVTYDSLTLTRIDRLQDNLILLIYLLLLGVLIVLTQGSAVAPFIYTLF